jgi:hypothetical protein
VKGQGEQQEDFLRAIYEELRGLRESVNEIHTKISHAAPAQTARARAVSVEEAQTLLGCGRSRIFELLRSGALRRGPKVGRVAMICAKSLEALLGACRSIAPNRVPHTICSGAFRSHHS